MMAGRLPPLETLHHDQTRATGPQVVKLLKWVEASRPIERARMQIVLAGMARTECLARRISRHCGCPDNPES